MAGGSLNASAGVLIEEENIYKNGMNTIIPAAITINEILKLIILFLVELVIMYPPVTC